MVSRYACDVRMLICMYATCSWLIMIMVWHVMLAKMIMMMMQLFNENSFLYIPLSLSLSLSRFLTKKLALTQGCTRFTDYCVNVVAINLLDGHNIIVCWLTSSVATFIHYFQHTHALMLALSHKHIKCGEQKKIQKVCALIH